MPDEVQHRLVDSRIERHLRVRPGEPGNLRVYISFPEFSKIIRVTLQKLPVRWQRERLQVTEDNSQLRHFVGQAQGGLNQVQPRVGHLKRQASLGKCFHVVDHIRLVNRSYQV